MQCNELTFSQFNEAQQPLEIRYLTGNGVGSSSDTATLVSRSIPTAIRLKELQSVLISIGTYGGELFGMSEQRNNPI
ncbi:hypothetical protein BB561_004331 [Smittium simulii]|uniref:Uncharacterized protein n=1 Tax=Smittium simulii TaxID=133385 RepID=A0A2T9YH20_9FUNG|nr:hypothetical protein BB561_004331 [Smittium simulii]